eukprot:CAMPEP_0172497428 /NCGR_PEP_ID=MMETSP1066-20121228/99756_1 /TAXON_ID=671091 /ORGANISM="Coscinodiscus wailesii, Strain CCMP2513" /LENGTH=438 /DNA_ID=CAMNT_0013270199 /DNA_START=56 /DNA_END=1368 /DNA_ORIENTATION=-
MTLAPGRYRLSLVEIDSLGNHISSSSGEVELSSHDGSVHGVFGECPIIRGSWFCPSSSSLLSSPNEEKHPQTREEDVTSIRFVILYNSSLPFEYSIDIANRRGTWRLMPANSGGDDDDDDEACLLPDQHGTLRCDDWCCIESYDERVERDLASVHLPANHACQIKHLSSVPVPCCMCNLQSPSSRLSFFSMTIPQFGTAELVSFSCGGCLYRHNQLRPTEHPKDYGVTLRRKVTCGRDLDGAVVLTDTASVTVDAVELEMTASAGRYTTVEGVLRGCCAALRNSAGIFTDGDGDGGNGIRAFNEKVEDLIEKCRLEEMSFWIQIDDPLGLSYLDGACLTKWERTPEVNEELGLVEAVTVVSGTCEGYDLKAPSVAGINVSSTEAKKFLKAAEALAAEYTKEYKYQGDDDNSESLSNCDSACDDDDSDFGLENATTGYG